MFVKNVTNEPTNGQGVSRSRIVHVCLLVAWMIGSNELSHWSHSHVYVQVHLLIDQINAAIVDFNKAVTLQPNFPVAYVQKLYTDYRQFLLLIITS